MNNKVANVSGYLNLGGTADISIRPCLVLLDGVFCIGGK